MCLLCHSIPKINIISLNIIMAVILQRCNNFLFFIFIFSFSHSVAISFTHTHTHMYLHTDIHTHTHPSTSVRVFFCFIYRHKCHTTLFHVLRSSKKKYMFDKVSSRIRIKFHLIIALMRLLLNPRWKKKEEDRMHGGMNGRTKERKRQT